MSVSYEDRISNYLSEDDPIQSLTIFEESKLITHVNLHIFPFYIFTNEQETLPLATISFQIETLGVILGENDRNINNILSEGVRLYYHIYVIDFSITYW